MPSLKEIKTRIKSVADTQKITNAMYLISSTRLNTAKQKLNSLIPYFSASTNQMNIISNNSDDIAISDTEKTLIIMLGSMKGLNGGFGRAVVKYFTNNYLFHKNIDLICIGDNTAKYLNAEKINFSLYNVKSKYDISPDISNEIFELVNQNTDKYCDIYLLFSDYFKKNKISVIKLFPLSNQKSSDDNFEVIGNKENIEKKINLNYIKSQIYNAYLSNYCCEQSQAMLAMDSANTNAKKLLEELQLKYNRIRQNAITESVRKYDRQDNKN